MEALRIFFTWMVKLTFWGAAGLLSIGVAVERSPWWLTGFGLIWLGSLCALGKYRMSWSAIIPHTLVNIYFLVTLGIIVSDKNANVWWLIVALLLGLYIVGRAQNIVDEEEKKKKATVESSALPHEKRDNLSVSKTKAEDSSQLKKEQESKSSQTGERKSEVRENSVNQDSTEKEKSPKTKDETGNIELAITSMRRIDSDLSFLLPGCRSNGVNFIGVVNDRFYVADSYMIYSSLNAKDWKQEEELSKMLSERGLLKTIKRVFSYNNTACFVTAEGFYLIEKSGIRKITFSFGEICDLSTDGKNIYVLASRKENVDRFHYYMCQGENVENLEKITKLSWYLDFGNNEVGKYHPVNFAVFKGTFIFLLHQSDNVPVHHSKMQLVTSKDLDDFTCAIDNISYSGAKITAFPDICYYLHLGDFGYYYTTDGEKWNSISRNLRAVCHNGKLYLGFVHDRQDELIISLDGIQWHGIKLLANERLGQIDLVCTQKYIFIIGAAAWIMQGIIGKNYGGKPFRLFSENLSRGSAGSKKRNPENKKADIRKESNSGDNISDIDNLLSLLNFSDSLDEQIGECMSKISGERCLQNLRKYPVMQGVSTDEIVSKLIDLLAECEKHRQKNNIQLKNSHSIGMLVGVFFWVLFQKLIHKKTKSLGIATAKMFAVALHTSVPLAMEIANAPYSIMVFGIDETTSSFFLSRALQYVETSEDEFDKFPEMLTQWLFDSKDESYADYIAHRAN